MGFPGGSENSFPGGKESACNVGELSSIPGLERSPGGGHGNPLQNSWLENPHGQRSLVGHSPWGHKESDTTEWLSTAQYTIILELWSFTCICLFCFLHHPSKTGKCHFLHAAFPHSYQCEVPPQPWAPAKCCSSLPPGAVTIWASIFWHLTPY